MAIRFIVDSASDILPTEAQKLGITVLPMKVLFGAEEFLDGITLNHKDFYEKLKTCDNLPTTCQVPPADWEEAYKTITANGDTAIVITISSGLSGTYQSASIASEDYEGMVYVVDSQNVTLGQRLLVMRGLELANQGLPAAEIVSTLEEEKHRIRLFALLDTLEYLKKGGRISAATALAGTLLSIKPLVSVENGKVVMAGKARGSKQGAKALREMVDSTGGIDPNRPHCAAYSGMSDAALQSFLESNPDLWQCQPEDQLIATVGSTIGTHVGPGAYAISFFEK
jgi:DegV family protein with EDD domain